MVSNSSAFPFSSRATAAAQPPAPPKQQQPRQAQKSSNISVCRRTSLVFVLHVAIRFFICSCSNTNLVQASSSSRASATITNVAQELTRNSDTRDDIQRKSTTMEPFKGDNNSEEVNSDVDTIKIVFSDVDGTLLHYPSLDHSDDKGSNNNDGDSDGNNDDDDDNEILRLPPSSTGLVGIISSRSLQQCQEIRRVHGCKLVLVSGMRTSTLLQRLPFLPKADAYCSEAGGRIFYPTTPPPVVTAIAAHANANDPVTSLSPVTFTPKPFSGATASDLEPFGMVEDLEWKRRMERLDAAGSGGYDDSNSAAVEERSGALWEFARELQRRGLVCDTKGYSTCFRVNRIHNNNNDDENIFDKVLLAGKIDIPKQLASSTNLGCVDFYPAVSGKKNWYVPSYVEEIQARQKHRSIFLITLILLMIL
jgi:hypothetical protein